MRVVTKLFGEIEVAEDKVILFEAGIIGFPDMQRFLLIHDAENENSSISWLQSLDEPAFAMPVADPLVLLPDYNPMMEDDILEPLGDMSGDNMLVLVTVTVTSDITKMTANFKAPIIIHAKNHRACQIIVEDDTYEVRHPIYDLLKNKNKEA